MPELTYVEAARQALAEEMARDETIFVVGEGIGPRGGNFNTTTGLFDLYGPERLARHPDMRARLRRFVCWRGHDRYAAGCGFHVLGLHPRCVRRTSQPDRQDAVHEQRPPEDAHRLARLHWRRRRGRHPSLGQLLSDLYASARLQGRGAVQPVRRQGSAQDGPARRRPSALS